MMKSATLFGLMFLFFSLFLQAQDDSKRPVSELPFFIDADAGFMLTLNISAPIWLHASLGTGYRINPTHAVGLEYRTAYFEEGGGTESGSGLGGVYRFTRKGIYAKTALGLILNSKKGFRETTAVYDYTGSGSYQSVTLGYQFRNGIMVGATINRLANRNFDRSRFVFAPDFTDDEFAFLLEFPDLREAPAEAGVIVPDGESQNTLYTYTLTFGYTFPQRKRN